MLYLCYVDKDFEHYEFKPDDILETIQGNTGYSKEYIENMNWREFLQEYSNVMKLIHKRMEEDYID